MKFNSLITTLSMAIAVLFQIQTIAQTDELPVFLKDRGTGVPISSYGAFINKGEFFLFPYVTYYAYSNADYMPSEFGYNSDSTFFGRYRGVDIPLDFGYGISDNLVIELTIAAASVSQSKAKDDLSAMPNKIEESGLNEIKSNLIWRFLKETKKRPEFYTNLVTVLPFPKDKLLIGVSGWEFLLGVGTIKGFRWGTLMAHTSFEYLTLDNEVAFAGFTIGYYRRFSDLIGCYLGLDGVDEFISDVQFNISPNATIRVQNAVGISEKLYVPEFGVMFRW